MKVVILAGGLGTRLSEETVVKPKPMVEIGSKSILGHIMKTFSHYGLNDFIIRPGHKGYLIKVYFANYFLRISDATIHLRLASSSRETRRFGNENRWSVSLATINCKPMPIMASGTQWTALETAASWSRSGLAANQDGESGD